MRDELPYAMKMLDYSRHCLEKIMECKIGIDHDFKVAAGKLGKYYKNYLTAEEFEDYRSTYPSADYTGIWEAIFAMCGIFPAYAQYVAQEMGFEYRADYEKKYDEILKGNEEKIR